MTSPFQEVSGSLAIDFLVNLNLHTSNMDKMHVEQLISVILQVTRILDGSGILVFH